jgi:hypothetical protein
MTGPGEKDSAEQILEAAGVFTQLRMSFSQRVTDEEFSSWEVIRSTNRRRYRTAPTACWRFSKFAIA